MNQDHIKSTERQLKVLKSQVEEAKSELEKLIPSRKNHLANLSWFNRVKKYCEFWLKIEGQKKNIRFLVFQKNRCQDRLDAMKAE